MMTYGAPTWWRNKKLHTNLLSRIQNIALRRISGAFHTTPAYAMQLECSIPPIDLTLDYIVQRSALHFARLDTDNPILSRLPPDKQIFIPSNTNTPPPPHPYPSPEKKEFPKQTKPKRKKRKRQKLYSNMENGERIRCRNGTYYSMARTAVGKNHR
jgi:hypothetical protein